MNDTFDTFARVVATGLPRRQLLKGIGTGFGVALATMGRPSELLAYEQRQAGRSKRKAISLVVHMPGGHRPVLTLFDRSVGRLSYNGLNLKIIPQIAAVGRTVEVSLYTPAGNSATLQQRLTLTLHRKGQRDASPTQLGFAEAQGLAVAALMHDDMPVSSTYNPDLDCTVSCCWGGSLSGPACCCRPGDPGCGSCCDAGWCPACS
jgi:hypothetical protein